MNNAQGKRKNSTLSNNKGKRKLPSHSNTKDIKKTATAPREPHSDDHVPAESTDDEEMKEDEDSQGEGDDDMSQSGEEEEEENEDEDAEQSDLDTKMPKGKGKGNKQPTEEESAATFASAMANILGSTLKVADRKAPILAKSKGAERRIEDAKLEHKARKAITTEKKKLASKDRVIPDYTRLDYERKLKKVATKGVVKLFNAIKEHHKLGSEDTLGKSAATKEKVANMSKANFLDLLKSGKDLEQPVQ